MSHHFFLLLTDKLIVESTANYGQVENIIYTKVQWNYTTPAPFSPLTPPPSQEIP